MKPRAKTTRTKVLPNTHDEPPRDTEDHRDFLLKEAKWMYDCFVSEHRWKIKSFKAVIYAAAKYLTTKDNRIKKRREEEDKRLRLIAKNVSYSMSKFWNSIAKIVRHRKIGKLNTKLREKQFEKLDRLVEETERYYRGIQTTFVKEEPKRKLNPEVSNIISENIHTETDYLQSVIDTVSDDEDANMDDWNEIEKSDLKLDIEMSSTDEEKDRDAELKDLDIDANLSIEELYAKYYGSEKMINESRSSSKKENSAIEDTPVESEDQIYSETMDYLTPTDNNKVLSNSENEESSINFDSNEEDIEELEAEKEMSEADKDDASNWSDECAALENEANMPMEDLLINIKGTKEISNIPEKLSRKHKCTENPYKQELLKRPIEVNTEVVPICVEIPHLLRLKMREYQCIGLNWLAALFNRGLNGILADEMGLGKTIQTIALLAYLACSKGIWGQHLIVVPTSVMLNWEMEFKRWLPGFKVLTYFGNPKERQKKRSGWNDSNAFNVCIASYTLILQDAHIFRRKRWQYLILDEAQNIKNFRSQKWQTLLSFNTQRRLLLTGTPLQNNLLELWSLLHFLMPKIFSSHYDFKTWFADPLTSAIEQQQIENERTLLKRLHTVLRPFLLRRLKRDVEKEMPSKVEHVIRCPLSKRQKELYDEFLELKSTKQTLNSGDYIGLMNVLMQLRKVCNHPDLFEPRLILTPIGDDNLRVKFTCNSSLYRCTFDVTSTSSVPFAGPKVSSRNYIYHSKISQNQINYKYEDSLLENLCDPIILSLPELFLLHYELRSSKRQIQTQSELSFNYWKLHQDKNENLLTNTKFYIQETSSNFCGLALLPEVNKFISMQLDKIANKNYAEVFAVGAISQSKMFSTCKLSPSSQLHSDNTNNPTLSSIEYQRLNNLVNLENFQLWAPSCDFPYLTNKIIQKSYKLNMKMHNSSQQLLTIQQSNLRVIYGTDCRSLIWNELHNAKQCELEKNQIWASSFPNASPQHGCKLSNKSTKIPPPLWCHYNQEKISANIYTKSTVLEGLVPNISIIIDRMYRKLALFTTKLSHTILPLGVDISLQGKGSIIKREWALQNYINPEILCKIRRSVDVLHKASYIQKCLVPLRRTIEDDCGKFQILSTLLHNLKKGDHRCIIFTQMSKMLDILEAFINFHGYTYLRLDGGTKVDARQKLVDRFNKDRRLFLFISSTRSGGVGLNLTGADTVIFYDSDWNPAMDRQAMDRCHRIGQTRDVHIYRLLSEWTIEENIFRKQLQKRLLDDVVVDQGQFTTEFITKGDIQNMLGTRSQNMLNSNDDIYATRILHESSTTNESMLTSNNCDPNRKAFEEALGVIEDKDDVSAMNVFSKELATENDEFLQEFRDKTQQSNYENYILESVDMKYNRNTVNIPVESSTNIQINDLLQYCIRFLEEVALPPDIKREIDLIELQIEAADMDYEYEEETEEEMEDKFVEENQEDK
ncbi:helicase SWR1 protein [Cryptosporidium andersoni]|uniref:Helicase SWR1 protein n=1 Tax=Cryptosporidium andersoni TaxID=117008 RepID=A0A1J4MSR0_9CRYT|nr:helicase SWR1 protein [Cryptosporidium andersoni]